MTLALLLLVSLSTVVMPIVSSSSHNHAKTRRIAMAEAVLVGIGIIGVAITTAVFAVCHSFSDLSEEYVGWASDAYYTHLKVTIAVSVTVAVITALAALTENKLYYTRIILSAVGAVAVCLIAYFVSALTANESGATDVRLFIVLSGAFSSLILHLRGAVDDLKCAILQRQEKQAKRKKKSK